MNNITKLIDGWWTVRLQDPFHPDNPDSPCVLLDRRLRWLVEVLCGRSVFCWWLLLTGLVAMMLSLYLLIRDSFVLSFPDGKRLQLGMKRQTDELQKNSPPRACGDTLCKHLSFRRTRLSGLCEVYSGLCYKEATESLHRPAIQDRTFSHSPLRNIAIPCC